MTTCLGKSCSFGLLRAFRKLLSIYVLSCFPFGFEGRMWYLFVLVPDHCLSFTFHSSCVQTVKALARDCADAQVQLSLRWSPM